MMINLHKIFTRCSSRNTNSKCQQNVVVC